MRPPPRKKATTVALSDLRAAAELPFTGRTPSPRPPAGNYADADTGTLADAEAPPATKRRPAWLERQAMPAFPPPPPEVRQAYLEQAAEQGATAASAAAAFMESERERRGARGSGIRAAPTPKAVAPLDLLWFDEADLPRLNHAPLLHEGAPDVEAWLDTSTDGEVHARRRVLDVLANAPIQRLAAIAPLLHARVEGELGARPLVRVDGTWVTEQEPLERLRVWIDMAKLYVTDEAFHALADEIRERALHEERAGLPTSVIDNLRRRLEQAMPRGSGQTPRQVVDEAVERMLVERRSRSRITVLGGDHIRGGLNDPASREPTLCAYLPEVANADLPLLAQFPAALIAELRPSQEAAGGVCLRVVALARHLHLER